MTDAFADLAREHGVDRADVPPQGDEHAPHEPAAGNGQHPTAELEFVTLADLRARVRRRGPRRFLVRGIWPAGTYGVHGAPMKAQKSWNALDLAVSVASGTPWLGYASIDDPGPVVVFWGEGDDAGLVRRTDAIAESRRVDPDELPIVVCCRVPHLSRDAHIAEFRAQVASTRPKLVVLDPLYLAARGGKIGDLYGMGQLLEAAQHVCQEHGAALVVVTHYNRKQGTGPERLTGAGPAEWGRVLIGVTVRSRRTDASTQETTVVADLEIIGGDIPDQTLRVRRRVRAGDPDDLDSPLTYHVEAAAFDGQAADTVDGELAPAEVKLLEAVRATASQTDPSTRQQLVDWILAEHGHGLKRETCSRALNRLMDLGYIECTQESGRASLWWPVETRDEGVIDP